MKDKGIKHTGSPLGRPKYIDKQQKLKFKKKNNERNHIEGKFGQGKQKYGLDKLRTKTVQSSLCAINYIVLTMNAMALLKAFLLIKIAQILKLLLMFASWILDNVKPQMELAQLSGYNRQYPEKTHG